MEEFRIEKIRKRDGSVVPFDRLRIVSAIGKAFLCAGRENKEKSEQLADRVMAILDYQFDETEIPSVEQIQDIVERVLVKAGEYKVAKEYILYRKQHQDIREMKNLLNSDEIVREYVDKLDWTVKENANMDYSLQGLNVHISEIVVQKYWLTKIYSPKVKKAQLNKDIHIHDSGFLGAYCVGWDLKTMLAQGFGGVPTKIESNPPKHLRTAIGQISNFFFTLQGEAAGAQALSNFDTLLAPFVRYDNLDYKDVQQCVQEFMNQMNVPTRVGFQCLSEDTEILAEDGWKGYADLKAGDLIKTFNIDTGAIESQKINSLFKKQYSGIMYNLKNRIQDQLISPQHRVVRKKFQTDKRFVLEPIEEVMARKAPFITPITGKNTIKDRGMSDEQIRLMAWIIAEGSVERPGKHRASYRITIYQSKIKNRKKYEEIIKLLKHFKLSFTERDSTPALGDKVKMIRLNAESSKKIHAWFGTKDCVSFLPDSLLNLSRRQSGLFLDTYLKADGFEDCKIATTDIDVLNGLQILAVNSEHGFTVLKRAPTIGTKTVYVLRLIKHQDTYINTVERVNYKGVIWCPNTKNETVIARRNGKVFITGNTPFTNVTMDLKVPEPLADERVVVGGKEQKDTYADFQYEMDLVNKAFAEITMGGDKRGRVFTFPIPTYNVTKDFDWNNELYDPIWEMTAKYGVPYFANFVNSDMKPDDARSMCLHPDEEIIVRIDGEIQRHKIGRLIESSSTAFDSEGWAENTKNIEALSLNPETLKTEWAKVKRFLKVKKNIIKTIKTEDGKKIKVSDNHLVSIFTPEGIKERFAKDVREGDYLISLKDASSALSAAAQAFDRFTLNEDLAKILGFFTADGNYLFSTNHRVCVHPKTTVFECENRKNLKSYGSPRGLQFTFNSNEPELIAHIKELISRTLGCRIREKKDPRYNTYYLYVYDAKLARAFFAAGFKKYGRLPQTLFNSPFEVIKSFLDYFFIGDGYEKRQEIHISDNELARDLVIMFSLIGIPTILRKREKSQIIYLQHKKADIKSNGLTNNPLLCERVPGFLAKSTYVVPGLNKNRTVGLQTLQKYSAETELSRKIEESSIYLTRVASVATEIGNGMEFYDLELENNHLFVHSLGTITHNCCRLRLDNRELRKRGGGLFGASPLTGSLGVVTLNMPRIGYVSKDENEYFERLTELMDIAKDSLEVKRKVVESFTARGLYPYIKFYLANIKESTGTYWTNHFSTIGINGMNESLLNFLGENIASETGKKFALKVLDFMRNKMSDYQEETENMYNLEATPGEGCTYKFALKDKEKFPDIIVANEAAYKNGAKPFYTNSTHLPVDYTDDLFEALDLQDELQIKYTGGTVFHAFLGERMPSIESTKKLVRKIASSYRLPYYTLTPTFSVCPKHGYLAGEHEFCPKCDIELGYVKINDKQEVKQFA